MDDVRLRETPRDAWRRVVDAGEGDARAACTENVVGAWAMVNISPVCAVGLASTRRGGCRAAVCGRGHLVRGFG